MTNKELDKWYSEYCKVNNQSPTWGELMAKAKELEEKNKKGA